MAASQIHLTAPVVKVVDERGEERDMERARERERVRDPEDRQREREAGRERQREKLEENHREYFFKTTTIGIFHEIRDYT